MKTNKIEAKYIILISLVIITTLLGIFSATKSDTRKLTKVEVILKDVITTIEKVVYKPFIFIGDKIEENKEKKDIYAKNIILELENEKYKLIYNENEELKEEIEKLKELSSIDNVLSEYEYLNASVITRNVITWHNEIIIDKGINNGVEVGMAVISPSGLIGEISSVTNFTSTVRLITDTSNNNKISIKINSGKKIYGVINGYNIDTETLIAEITSSTDNIKVGDIITTSGLGDKFPSGILIGTVSNIKTDEYGLSNIIEISPSASINDLSYITILKRKSKL